MGTNYYVVKKKPTISDPLHIGKSSAGWKFLFQEVNKYNSFDWDLEIHTFEQWKEFLKNNNEIVILNEYDEEVSVKDFASRNTGITITTISYACNNKRKTGGGFIWHFV